MRIAIIVPSLRDLAPVTVAITIAGNLANSGNTVTVFYLSNRIEIKIPGNVRFEKLSFKEKVDWKKYDIVHSHGFLPDAFVFLKKPLKRNIKAVTTIHNYVFTDLKSYYNWMVSWMLGFAWLILWTRFDALAVLTDDAVKYYQSRSINKNIFRIYNGRDIQVKPDVISADHRKIIKELRSTYAYVIGVYAVLIPRKRIDLLIKHLSRVSTGCLIILGEGSERGKLENLVLKFNLADRVKFLGHIPQGHQYNEVFDIFAHPSSSEGFSLSLIEAALHQKKIVCSDIPGFREAFNDTEVTFFDSSDELSIDQVIQEALRDDMKALNAFQKANTLYSEKNMALEYFKLYSLLM